MNKYQVVKTLGEGGFGEAILVKRKSDNVEFVIKKVSLNGLGLEELSEALKEAEILKTLDSPYIVKYIESFTDNGMLCIVMEYAEGGDLAQKIVERRGNYFQEDEVMRHFIQIVHALKYVHDRKVLHRDIKSKNIFLCSDGSVKLGDFGIAKVLDSTSQMFETQISTPLYESPEIVNGEKYNSKADVWSLGCVLCELCTLKYAFNARSKGELIASILRGSYTPIPLHFSSDVRELIDKMLQKDPKDRPSIDQILEMPFIMNRIGGLPNKMKSEVFTYEARDGDMENVYRVKNKNVTKVTSECLYELVSLLKKHRKTSLSKCFSDCSKLTVIDFPAKFDTSNVTDMTRMFIGCSSLGTLDLSTFNTSNVTDMSYLFNGCSCLSTLDLSTFDTSNVTNMSFMFAGCSRLSTLDLTAFNTSSVTDMSDMFCRCSSLRTLSLSTFNTSNVTNMGSMFNGCSVLVH